jgi:hypothetical protein
MSATSAVARLFAKLCGLKPGCTEAVRISISAAPFAGRMRWFGADVTQCPAVSTRSRASAEPVQRLPREPSTITTERAMPSAAGVAPPTIAAAGANDNNVAVRAATLRCMSAIKPLCRDLSTRHRKGSVTPCRIACAIRAQPAPDRHGTWSAD